MDKQSRTISIKVNGTEANYIEKKEEETKKEEFEWVLPENTVTNNVVSFQKHAASSMRKGKKGWSNRFILTVSTAIVIGTGFGMGMLHLLAGKETVRETTVPAANVTEKNETKKPTNEQTEEKKTEEKKTAPAALSPLTIYFVQGGVFSSKEKGQASLKELQENGVPGAVMQSGDRYLLVLGMAHDEQSVMQTITQYKQKDISVVKKKWEITDQALLKQDQEYGAFLEKLQSLYGKLLQQAAAIQSGNKISKTDMEQIENEWKAIKKEEAALKRDDIKKLFTYASVAVQTIQEGKQDMETMTKLQQVLVDSFLSYEKIVSQKNKNV
ncbi:stage II sporulation protein B [Bacillus cereus group sp. BfR-BA-01380]|uniref:stage II sporulation protein B n=1 Tax=Bacillus cereus group sp. BfR-BA-01380 TaxID=2920324 RepID=UPI001F57F15B|nr:stage II sporulation protein B [Bacillus cereus group sp. BfR-BA-01380]